MPKARNMPDEYKARNSKTRLSEDDVEGHALKTRITPGEGLLARNTPDEYKAKNSKTRVSGEDDVEGHWMPDASSSMRLAKARSSEVERGARQHQLENEARQHRAEHDPKRTHTKG